MSFIPLLQAADATGSQSMLFSVLPFVLLIAIFWVFIIRPQNKKQKEAEKMRESVQKGDKIITIGGIHGTVSAVREKTVVLKVEDGSRIEFDRSAISFVSTDRKSSKSEKPEKIEVESKESEEPEKSEKIENEKSSAE